MKDGSYLGEVRNQYENYPYPARDPEDEKQSMFISKAISLDCINHYCFEGKQDFNGQFRVLVAGGGTGDETNYFAEQLRDHDAEVVYLDMSESSMSIAKKRAEIRQNTNITWVHESILNITPEALGKFDFICCTGVLHHLAEPDEGLSRLESVLKEDGAMYLMVYAQIGRAGVYQMQDLMRRINKGSNDIQKDIDRTKHVISHLPPGNWFKKNQESCQQDLASDAGIYDLLLHTQDRAYTVPEMYEFIRKPGLTLNKLFNPDHPAGDYLFDIATYIKEGEIIERVRAMPIEEQEAICELLVGQMMKQCCFASKREVKPNSPTETTLVPCFSTMNTRNGLEKAFINEINQNKETITINGMFTLRKGPVMVVLINSIDGEKTIDDIVTHISTQLKLSEDKREQVILECGKLLELLIKLDMVYLTRQGVNVKKSIPDMIERVRRLY